MTTRQQLVDEAITWVGTPFRANQATKGVGADCVGVVAGIAMACGVPLNYRNDYPMRPDGTMLPWMRSHLIRVNGEPQAGDVLAMSFGAEPHHVALYIGNSELVHAYVGARRCVRQLFDEYWRDHVQGVFSFPGIT